jgi:hypothetical protein
VPLDDLLDDGQADPRPLVLVVGVEPRNISKIRSKYSLLDPDPVVPDRELPSAVSLLGRDPDLGRHAGPAVLDRVPDQVREDLLELGRVGQDAGHRADRDRRAGLADRARGGGARRGDDRARVRRLEGLRPRLDPRDLEQVRIRVCIRRPPSTMNPMYSSASGRACPFVPPFEELAEADDAPERLLQVVAGHATYANRCSSSFETSVPSSS